MSVFSIITWGLLPSALAWGSESRIYSQKVCMYVRAYIHGWSRSGMSRGMCVTLSDTFRYARLRYWSWATVFFDNGDDGRGDLL